MTTQSLTIQLPDGGSVSGLWQAPETARACLLLAHGAGAGMTHRAMTALADGLVEHGIATLRFQFPYMERGRKGVDTPAVAQAAVRAAAGVARERAGRLPLFAGGRSFGGRMTALAQAEAPLGAVRGLVFFAFPLHAAGKPSVERAAHLARIEVPMLFVQGTRDALAELGLLCGVIGELGARADLQLVPDADHAFHVPAKSGRRDADVLAEALTAAAGWMLSR